jgi:kynurenine formamidase
MDAANPRNRRSAIDTGKLVDLTYSLDEDNPQWPTDPPFEWRADHWGFTGDGHWYAAGRFSTPEHIGTHLDAPVHFGAEQVRVGAIPVERLVAAAVVIDVRATCAGDRDYSLSAADILAWEGRHGAIGNGEIVLVHTGWGRYWPDREAYMGSARQDDAGGLSFPGVGPDAAALLRDRGVSGVGIDTAGIDAGRSEDFASHRILNNAGIFHLENLANLDRLPETGATLVALPLKLAAGSGAPARVIAILP